MDIQTLVVGPFQVNCFILSCVRTGETAVIDAGDFAPQIMKALGNRKVKYLLHTHAHLDHIGASREVAAQVALRHHERPKLALHRQDEPIWKELRAMGKKYGLQYEDPAPVDMYLEDGQELELGDVRFRVLHTPGHSPGGVCFLASDAHGQVLFSGDTLFAGSVGRTDLWGGDSQMLLQSIRNKILVLEDGLRVLPGHGPETTVHDEKQDNPYLDMM